MPTASPVKDERTLEQKVDYLVEIVESLLERFGPMLRRYEQAAAAGARLGFKRKGNHDTQG